MIVRGDPLSYLDIARQAAYAAGEILRSGFGQSHSVRMKGPTDPVTEIDQTAEECILRLLRSATPAYGFLAEESGTIAGTIDNKWIVDPLDGTVNYCRGYPRFCVSIALECAGELELGVVYDPLRDELFAAQRAQGATLNGIPLQVSSTPSLKGAVISTGFPYDAWTSPRDNAAEVTYFVKQALALRSSGSAALDLANVASGSRDAHWEYGLSPYDKAAGILLIREAGGTVTDYAGSPNALYGEGILAANLIVHMEMLAYLRTRYATG